MSADNAAWTEFIEMIPTDDSIVSPGAYWRPVHSFIDDEGEEVSVQGWVEIDGRVHLPSLIAAAIAAGLTSDDPHRKA